MRGAHRRLSWAAALLAVAAAPAGVRAAVLNALTRSTVVEVSTGCAGQNAEVRQAVDARLGYLYEAWRGCGGIAFARSTDGGKSFSAAEVVPGSPQGGVDDPSVAVAPDGTVYVAYMSHSATMNYPVVVASFDHGATFPQLTRLIPPSQGNWGDADALAVASDGTVYVTWDYGPSRSSVRFVCTPGGSCSFTAGEFNVVIQRSTDRGTTFGPFSPVSPGFPASGADSGPLVIERGGRIDVLYQGYREGPAPDDRLAPASSYFTASDDGGRTWSRPVAVGREAGTMSDAEWWTDGDIGIDAGGNLYATWDTQSALAATDTGWLSVSTDHGRTWSAPEQVAAQRREVPHITEVAGGPAGVAYVAWMTDCCGRGYATYLRAFRIGVGWTSRTLRVSDGLGNPMVYPGDNFGLSSWAVGRVALGWGSAVEPGSIAEVYASTVIAG